MRLHTLIVWGLSMALPFTAAIAATPAPSPWLGEWQATASQSGLDIPFHYRISRQGGHALRGSFFNGEDALDSDPATPAQDHLILRYPAFDRVLDLHLTPQGDLVGSYTAIHPGPHSPDWHIEAHRPTTTAPATAVPAPDFDGLWIVPAASRKQNEHAWRLIVHQQFGELSAALLGVGGDTGALTGSWQDGRWQLSNFSGTRAEVATVTPRQEQHGDLTLDVQLAGGHGGSSHYTAYRPDTARRLGLPEAADLGSHTTVRDPDEVFAFDFPDLHGHRVANTDARFRHKVLLVDVSGSWCPNCHDEAPLLEALYRKYHARGLEIVTLDFEDPDQYRDPARLRAFIARYHTAFPVLLAGTTDQAQQKLPQAVNLDAWPTTFFIARDGRVRHIHTGFSAQATGAFHQAITREFEQQIETLLAQPAG